MDDATLDPAARLAAAPELEPETEPAEASPAGPETMDAMSDEEVLAQGSQVEISMPATNLVLSGARIQVARDEQTGERAIVIGPVAMHFVLPLSDEAARIVSRELAGGIEIAHQLPRGAVILKP